MIWSDFRLRKFEVDAVRQRLAYSQILTPKEKVEITDDWATDLGQSEVSSTLSTLHTNFLVSLILACFCVPLFSE